MSWRLLFVTFALGSCGLVDAAGRRVADRGPGDIGGDACPDPVSLDVDASPPQEVERTMFSEADYAGDPIREYGGIDWDQQWRWSSHVWPELGDIGAYLFFVADTDTATLSFVDGPHYLSRIRVASIEGTATTVTVSTSDNGAPRVLGTSTVAPGAPLDVNLDTSAPVQTVEVQSSAGWNLLVTKLSYSQCVPDT